MVIRERCDGEESFKASVWKIDGVTIKLIEHQLPLLSGFSLRTSSQPSFSGATVGDSARQAGLDPLHGGT